MAPSTAVMEEVMPQGVVKWFDARKGFGFIRGPDDGPDIFIHYSAIEDEGVRSLEDGEMVEYELVESEKGPQAGHVHRIKSPPSSP